MADRTQHEGKTERAKESHDRCGQPLSMRVLKIADLGTQALLVVNSFKLHLTLYPLRVPFGTQSHNCEYLTDFYEFLLQKLS